jgi:hypothetical protein
MDLASFALSTSYFSLFFLGQRTGPATLAGIKTDNRQIRQTPPLGDQSRKMKTALANWPGFD